MNTTSPTLAQESLTIIHHQPTGAFYLQSAQSVGYGTQRLVQNEVIIPFGSFSSRPDPIRRAWLFVEANRAMNPRPEPPAPPPPCTQALRNTLARCIDWLVPRTPAANSENRSQQVPR